MLIVLQLSKYPMLFACTSRNIVKIVINFHNKARTKICFYEQLLGDSDIQSAFLTVDSDKSRRKPLLEFIFFIQLTKKLTDEQG